VKLSFDLWMLCESAGGKDSDGTTSNASKSPKPGKAPSPEKMKYWKEHGFSRLQKL
jgi:tRNA (adenine58-N1)-methyltransferase non-catalytic subunit